MVVHYPSLFDIAYIGVSTDPKAKQDDFKKMVMEEKMKLQATYGTTLSPRLDGTSTPPSQEATAPAPRQETGPKAPRLSKQLPLPPVPAKSFPKTPPPPVPVSSTDDDDELALVDDILSNLSQPHAKSKDTPKKLEAIPEQEAPSTRSPQKSKGGDDEDVSVCVVRSRTLQPPLTTFRTCLIRYLIGTQQNVIHHNSTNQW